MSSRVKLLLLFLACAAPFVLGTLAYVFEWGTGGHGNYGELIEPRPIAAPPVAALKGKWVLVVFDTAACDKACEQKLYFIRQVRRAQGKEMNRLERLWVVTDAAAPRPELVAALEEAKVAKLENQAMLERFPGDPLKHVYLIDPLGNLMLRFPQDPEPSKVIKDLQRLLKYSRAG